MKATWPMGWPMGPRHPGQGNLLGGPRPTACVEPEPLAPRAHPNAHVDVVDPGEVVPGLLPTVPPRVPLSVPEVSGQVEVRAPRTQGRLGVRHPSLSRRLWHNPLHPASQPSEAGVVQRTTHGLHGHLPERWDPLLAELPRDDVRAPLFHD